jgi:archaemetzincin
VEAPEPEPVFAWDDRRRQYSSFEILRAVARLAGRPGVARVLGVTECDLFIPALTFVFGQAQLDGGAALVSFARLRQRFYGLPEDRKVFADRLRKEVTHELGHTLGLIHCAESFCAMKLSTNILQVDMKEDRLCDRCSAGASERIARWRQEDYEVAMEDPGRR